MHQAEPAAPAAPRRAKKRRPLPVRILLFVLALPFALALFLAAETLLFHQDAWDYIPKQFQAYLQVPSIGKVYDDWSQLDALHLAFGEYPGLAGLEKSLLAVKSSGFGQSPLFKALIDVQAHVVVDRSGDPLVVLDLGWRSALTRHLPLVAGLFKVDGLSRIEKDGQTYFRYDLDKNTSAYLLVRDNLALVAFKQAAVEKALGLKAAGKSLSFMEKTRITQEFAQAGSSSLRFLADPGALCDSFIGDAGLRGRLNGALAWQDAALVSLDLDNDSFKLRASTVLAAKSDAFKKIAGRRNALLTSLRSLPASTYFCTSVGLGDFRDLLQAWTALSGQDLKPTLDAVDSGAKTFLGMSTDELLWSWVGDEAGMLYLGANGDPVFHVKVKDEGRRQRVFKKLNDTALVDIDRSLTLDGVPIERIVIPDFVRGLLGLFGIAFDTPYFVVVGDQLFFSMNAENLSRLANELNQGKLLADSPDFQRMTAASPKNPVVFLYYNLERSTPFFLRESNLLTKVLGLYNRGALSLYLDDGYLAMDLGAVRVETRRVVPYPGFPLAVKGGIASPPWVGFLPGRGDPVVATVQGESLVLDALAGNERLLSAPVLKGTRLLPGEWGGDLLAWNPDGTFFRFDAKGASVAPFPLLSPSKGSFTPVPFQGRFLAFDNAADALVSLGKGGDLAALPLKFDAPVASQPAVRDNLAAVATKSFDGGVYLIDRAGAVQTGWPQSGGGIALSSPGFVDTPEGPAVYFLTQGGTLNLWRLDGSAVPGFPVRLKGVYAAAPAPLRYDGQTCLATLDQSGLYTLVKLDGGVAASAQFASGPEARLVARDIGGTGSDSLLVYGGKNTIDAYGPKGEPLSGFPVRGSFAPQFVDLNLDGSTEMVVASYDGNIYAYTLRK